MDYPRGEAQQNRSQTTEMKADGFTKPLTREKYGQFIKQLNMEVPPSYLMID
jgi:hypothetical protein